MTGGRGRCWSCRYHRDSVFQGLAEIQIKYVNLYVNSDQVSDVMCKIQIKYVQFCAKFRAYASNFVLDSDATCDAWCRNCAGCVVQCAANSWEVLSWVNGSFLLWAIRCCTIRSSRIERYTVMGSLSKGHCAASITRKMSLWVKLITECSWMQLRKIAHCSIRIFCQFNALL